MKKLLFEYLCTIHIIFWLFVVFAFVNVNSAKLNFFYVIPLVYLIHILPFHALEESKKQLYQNNYKEKQEEFFDGIFVGLIIKLQRNLDKYCFCSPISPQGMLILGALTSGYSIMYHNKIKL